MNANIQVIEVKRTSELPKFSVRYAKATHPSPAAALNAYQQERKPLVEPTVVFDYTPPGGKFGCWAIEVESEG